MLRNELEPKRFATIVLTLASVTFVVVATVNYIVNPYAQYGPTLFEPLVQTSRDEKVQLLVKALEAEEIPEGLILGSSRVMKLEPDYLEQKTGYRFFNAGVNHAKPEDYLAFLRFYRERAGVMPKMVVLGIDTYGFSDRNRTDARLLSNADLVRHVTDSVPLSDRLQRWKELLSWQQTKKSLTSVKRTFKKTEDEPPIESFRSDGLRVYHQREKQLAEGTYDFQSALDYNKHEYRQLFFGFDKLSSKRRKILERLVAQCKKSNTKLVVFLTPMHPELQSHLAHDNTLENRQHELTILLSQMARRDGFAFWDLSNVKSFAGDQSLFVDGIHPLEPNTRRMINRLVSETPQSHDYAVQ